jgi:hypothetical protein
VGRVFNLYQKAAPVQSTPDLGLRRHGIIAGTASPAVRTVVLVPCSWAGLDAKMGDTISVIVEIVGFYNCVLDIQDLFA